MEILLEELSDGWYLHCDPAGCYRKITLDDQISKVAIIKSHVYLTGEDYVLPPDRKEEMEDAGLTVHYNDFEEIIQEKDEWVGIQDGKLFRSSDGETWKEEKFSGPAKFILNAGVGFTVKVNDRWWLHKDAEYKLIPVPGQPRSCDGEYIAVEDKIYRLSDWEVVHDGPVHKCVLFQGHLTWSTGSFVFQFIGGKPVEIVQMDDIAYLKAHPHHLEIGLFRPRWVSADLKKWQQVSYFSWLMEDSKGNLWLSTEDSLERI